MNQRKTCGMAFTILVFLFTLSHSARQCDAAVPDTVQLSVKERAGIDRTNEFVNCGVPLPRAWNVIDIDSLRLTDASGSAVPAQFTVLARWGASPATPSSPIKWILVGFLHSITANGEDIFTLDRNGPGPAAAQQIQTDASVPGRLSILTGSAVFEINTDASFNLIHQVTIAGKTLLTPLNGSQAINASLRIAAGGVPNSVPRTTTVTIERSGALCTVVKAVGSLGDASTAVLLDYTARLYFFAGSTAVRVDFTIENNHPVLFGEYGQPTNVHDQGAVNSVYLDYLRLAFNLDARAGALRVLSESGVDASAPATPIRLYQDSSGARYWDAYVGDVGWEGQSAAPRLQSYCTLSGYTLTGPGISESGQQALGWITAFRGANSGITLAARDFWQNFPKTLEVGPEGLLSLDLFPNGSRFNHNLRVGEEKTHSFMVRFDTTTASATGSEALGKAFNKPLLALASAQWYVGSGALGEVPLADATAWPLYENYVNVAFKPNPNVSGDQDMGFGNTTLLDAIERYNFYGWQDYGDVPLDYESFGENQAGQMNLKYWFLYGMLTQFFRSGQTGWIDLAMPAARHLADIDYLHIPDDGIAHWSHGAYFGHSTHDEPGNMNPNRNYNSPSVDLFFGVPDLLLAYYFTGEQRFLDVAREGLLAMHNLAAQFSDYTYPVFYRERANLIFAFIEGYKQSGDGQILAHLRNVVGLTADTTTKGWLTDPDSYTPPDGGPGGGEERISGFQMGQVAWSLGRYLDFCAEYGITDDLNVAASLAAFSDFITNHMLFDIPSWFRQHIPDEVSQEVLSQYEGHVATIDSIWFTAPWETYLEVNNWSLLLADVLAYACKYNRTDRYLETAGRLYATGTLDTVWINDPPVYMATKDLANSCNFGLVYMNMLAGNNSNGNTAIDGGYTAISGLWMKAVLQTPGGPIGLVWKQTGTDTTPSADRVVSGYFYASPQDFAYGSIYNPEVFVKIYIAGNGWCNIAFNHVTVDNVDVYSAHNYTGSVDKRGTITLTGRLAEHEYTGVSLNSFR